MGLFSASYFVATILGSRLRVGILCHHQPVLHHKPYKLPRLPVLFHNHPVALVVFTQRSIVQSKDPAVSCQLLAAEPAFTPLGLCAQQRRLLSRVISVNVIGAPANL